MIKNILGQPYWKHLIFLVVILFQFDLYRYFTLLNELPMSTHMWRQTDCLSFALNYYQNGMDFFKPQIHHLLAGQGYTVAEFPGMYYLVAIAYHVFGPHIWVYRIIWMLLLFTGLFCFYKTLYIYLKDAFWSIVLTAFLFCSPVLVFYGNNFIIDPAALSFTMIAGYFFANYLQHEKKHWLLLSVTTFLFSGLLKEPALITFIALLCILIISTLKKWKVTGKMPAIQIRKTLLFVLPFLLVVCWYFIKKNYNETHYNVAFLAQVMPIWNLSEQELHSIHQRIVTAWVPQYFSPYAVKITGIAFLLNLFFLRKYLIRNLFPIILLTGGIGFFLLFYWQFNNHDYYIINVLLIIPVIWAVFIKNMEKWTIHHKMVAPLSKVAFAVLLYFTMLYASERQAIRYDDSTYWMIPDREKINRLKEADGYLTLMGIGQNEKIISIPDESTNITLFLLNRPGWTNLYRRNLSENDIQQHIDFGARYLVINDPALLGEAYLQPYLNKKIGDYEGIHVFELPQ